MTTFWPMFVVEVVVQLLGCTQKGKSQLSHFFSHIPVYWNVAAFQASIWDCEMPATFLVCGITERRSQLCVLQWMWQVNTKEYPTKDSWVMIGGKVKTFFFFLEGCILSRVYMLIRIYVFWNLLSKHK